MAPTRLFLTGIQWICTGFHGPSAQCSRVPDHLGSGPSATRRRPDSHSAGRPSPVGRDGHRPEVPAQARRRDRRGHAGVRRQEPPAVLRGGCRRSRWILIASLNSTRGFRSGRRPRGWSRSLPTAEDPRHGGHSPAHTGPVRAGPAAVLEVPAGHAFDRRRAATTRCAAGCCQGTVRAGARASYPAPSTARRSSSWTGRHAGRSRAARRPVVSMKSNGVTDESPVAMRVAGRPGGVLVSDRAHQPPASRRRVPSGPGATSTFTGFDLHRFRSRSYSR